MGNVQVYKNRRSGCGIWTALILLVIAIPVALICTVVGVSVGLAFNLVGNVEVLEASYEEPIDGAERVELQIGAGVAQLYVNAVDGQDNLFEADLRYAGELMYEAEGEATRQITLRNESSGVNNLGDMLEFLDVFNLGDNSGGDLRWDIDLNPGVSYDMEITGGVGELNLDLTAFELTNLEVDTGVGSVNLSLPAPVESYEVRISGGVGQTIVDVPDGVAVRLEAEAGVGDIDIPNGFERISGQNDSGIGEQGVWETAGFDEADSRITIEYTGGLGDFTINR